MMNKYINYFIFFFFSFSLLFSPPIWYDNKLTQVKYFIHPTFYSLPYRPLFNVRKSFQSISVYDTWKKLV